MGIEGENDGRNSISTGRGSQWFHDLAMSGVNTVKIADRHIAAAVCERSLHSSQEDHEREVPFARPSDLLPVLDGSRVAPQAFAVDFNSQTGPIGNRQ